MSRPPIANRQSKITNPLADGDPTPEKAAAERLLAVEVRLHCAERMLAAPSPAYRGRPELTVVK